MNCLVTSRASHEKSLIFGNSDSVDRVFVFVKRGNECSVWSEIRYPGTFDILSFFSVLI